LQKKNIHICSYQRSRRNLYKAKRRKKENIAMKNPQFPFMGGSFDYDASRSHSSTEQQALDMLMDTGFYWEEAIRLLYLREHLYENEEMHQRVCDDLRMQFVRWLYEQGEIHET
jgi:hypothetical protein